MTSNSIVFIDVLFVKKTDNFLLFIFYCFVIVIRIKVKSDTSGFAPCIFLEIEQKYYHEIVLEDLFHNEIVFCY